VFAAYAASGPPAVATLGRLYDDVVYLSVGKSIAEGHGYRSAQLVGTPVHAKFPPLLPAVYALGWTTFGTLDAVAQMAAWLSITIVAASAAMLWWLARHELQIGPACGALFVIVPLLTDRTMFYFTGAASEPWMLLGWVTALLLVRRLTRIAADDWSAPVTAMALGLTLAATALVRTQGIAIGAAVLVALGISRVGARVVLIAVVAAIVPLATWNIWHAVMMAHGPLSPLPDQRSYLSWIPTNSVTSFSRFAIAMVRTSVPLYWSNLAEILVGWRSAKTLLLAAAFMGSGLVGTVMLARKFPAMAASLAATLVVLVIWPYVQDRLLTPVLPVLGVAGAFALDRTLTRTPPLVQRGAIAGVTLLTITLAAMNARVRVGSARGAPNSPYGRAMTEIVGWVEQNTPANDHIMTAWGGVIYLRTGRRTSISNPEEPMLGSGVLDAPYRFYATRLLADSIDHVIIWDRAPGRAAAWLRALGSRCPGALTEMAPAETTFSAPSDVHYYRIRRDLPCVVELAGMAGTQE
jgi:hypothetical protein